MEVHSWWTSDGMAHEHINHILTDEMVLTTI